MIDNIERLQPGDVKIVTATVANGKNQGIDVNDMILELKIFENIFSPFITGTLTLLDSLSLNTILPFVGEEVLILELETPTVAAESGNQKLLSGMRRVMTFHIYKMSAEANIAMKSRIYTLNVISIEGFRDMNMAVSQKFSGNISDIVTTLLTKNTGLETRKPVVVEKTTNKTSYVSNFWTPAKNIYYLAEQAVNANNNPSFMFFENNEGFVFASVETLFNAPVLQTFFKDQKLRNGNEVPDVDSEYRRILDMNNSEGVFDYIDRRNLGAYGSTVYEYSFDVKGIRKTTLTRGNNPYSNAKATPENQVTANPSSKILSVPVHRNLFSGSQNLAPGHHTKRALVLKNMENIQTNIQVLGRMDYTAGRVVNLTIYKDKQIDGKDTTEQIVDKMYSGNYLITALCHVITKEGHICNMEISKASVKND